MLFRERLWVPLTWWVLSGLFALSLLLAIGFYLGWAWGLTVAAVSFLLAGAAFVALAAQITVSTNEVRVGRAMIELAYVGGCAALDAEQSRRRSGTEADARAYLALRPYLATAVELTVDDPDDPTPYWLVGTRRPQELAAAVSAALAERRKSAGH
ncbi:MAG: FIG01105974: Probable conserved alanine rich transmembrane protein [uncultured Propionibacteriaceae bacterium]|uniref:FIG01105974: Probable conserved alanine rich transmembrane protein n=1 Tax=uncultured Propionibacteriaceae bacterium TaxID=257457 RepID=A0A6J4PNM0_9ACTN|nr:MAG: FIG01105974: Probable conserved alanine rich transmembrane protein [uncultured Propionibacteriaceae bacterium]